MAPESTLKRISRVLLAIFFVVAGVNHFLRPGPYLAMMPPWLPWPVAMNQISGAAEIAGGLGILFPWKRRCAAWGLIALLVAVFPANLQVALHGWPGMHIPAWILWARLPFQPLLIAWVYLTCLRRDATQG
ncbi:MAG: DoxX family protein [Akkermansiaceae bacterium]|nr:DoxX family protein [Akkermansiaceae bacterium]